jgi:hypothetical protein
MVGTGTQKVNSVREFLGLLADDDHFRDSLQQNPGLALKYLGVLGNSTPVIPDTKGAQQGVMAMFAVGVKHPQATLEFSPFVSRRF